METAVPAPLAPPLHPSPLTELSVADLMPRAGAAVAAPSAIAPVPVAPALALHALGNVAPRRFFAGAGDPEIAALLHSRLGKHSKEIVTAADALTRDWALRQDGPFDARAFGDPVVMRDPARHQWLVRVAQAYTLTGHPQYADTTMAAIDLWLDRAGSGPEPGFADSVVAGSRMMSWCWALMLLRNAPMLDAGWLETAVAVLRQHAGHVHRSLSRYCPPPTHLTGNALALCYTAALFPDLPESAKWRDDAVRVLGVQSEVQIGADGVHVEQSTCFHVYTADVYLQFLLLAERAGIPVPPAVSRRIERMFEFLLAIRRPDGSMPSIGDADGAGLLPLAIRDVSDCRGRFAVAAAMFNRPDFAWAAEGLAPEVAWLMGADGVRTFDALRPAKPTLAPSRVFPSGGYAVLRSGWERDAHQMIVDIGPLGCPVSSGHGHADLLSLECAIFGEPAIVDPGTHCYGADSKWRDFFRSTAAHSTVTVDGASQVEATGPFGWRRQPRVRLREWHSTEDFDFVDAEHDGYTSLPDPVVHRRRVIFVKPGYWIVVDDLSGARRHDIELTFQFASADVRLEAHPWARAATPGGPVLWISPFPSGPAQPKLNCGDPSPTRGWISPEIARLSPAPMLIYSFAVALPWRIVTLLLPDRQGLSAPPAVRPIYDDGGLPHGFVFERDRRLVSFSDRAVLVERD
jgi:hypothetical protein